MKTMMTIVSLAAGVLLATASLAQAPAGAPAGATGQCNDGTYWTSATKSGACSGHKGVKEWYGAAAAAPAAAPAKAAPAAAPAKAATAPVAAGPAPAGATALCKDGTYWTGASKSGACSGHKGVQDWYGAAAAAPAAPAPTPSAAPRPAPAASAPANAPAATAAPGGGPGMVWVNPSSKTYHCPGDKWYGKTKSGQYMSEQQAVANGNHPDHGKTCNK
jgi:hypothetical protein